MVPRATSIITSTLNPSILTSAGKLLTAAMSDPTFSYPASTSMVQSDSTTSLNQQSSTVHSKLGSHSHQKSYSASITSSIGASGDRIGNGSPRFIGGAEKAKGELMLQDMGMQGLTEMSFTVGKPDRSVYLLYQASMLVILLI